MDARPSVNAVAQGVMGAGYENTANYETTTGIKKCNLEFVGTLIIDAPAVRSPNFCTDPLLQHWQASRIST